MIEEFSYTNMILSDQKKCENNISSTQSKICFGSSTNSDQLERSTCKSRVDKCIIKRGCVYIIPVQAFH